MALSFKRVDGAGGTMGTVREVFYDVTFDSSYPTGGESVSGKDVGLLDILGAVPIGQSTVSGSAPTTTREVKWDFKNKKLQAFLSGTEVANGTDLSTLVVRVRFIGV